MIRNNKNAYARNRTPKWLFVTCSAQESFEKLGINSITSGGNIELYRELKFNKLLTNQVLIRKMCENGSCNEMNKKVSLKSLKSILKQIASNSEDL